jgi:NAD(P)-dependent dehydrogenase (short-subunit alcohol dehydrogenase family)
MLLQGKTAVITGASRGIGKAIALKFAREGANIVFNYLEHGEDAERAANEIAQTGVRVFHLQGDVRTESSVRELFGRTAQEFETIDILVNNAGAGLTKAFSTIHQGEWNSMLNMHLGGVFLACQLAGESMRRNKSGSIINIASVAGDVALPHRVIYSTVQAGKMMFTKALACEWASFGIRVNCIAPGTILTDLVRKNFDSGLLDGARVLERTPAGRFGETSEVANAALFLASPQASYVTGQVLFVDGGWTSWGGWPVATQS